MPSKGRTLTLTSKCNRMWSSVGAPQHITSMESRVHQGNKMSIWFLLLGQHSKMLFAPWISGKDAADAIHASQNTISVMHGG